MAGRDLESPQEWRDLPQWLTVNAVRDAEGTVTHYVAGLTDITQRKLAEEEIRNLAFYDPSHTSESPAAHGPAPPGPQPERSQREPWRADVHRSGRLQGRERFAGPSCWRPAAAAGGEPPLRFGADDRHGREVGRRRIRDHAGTTRQPARSRPRTDRQGGREGARCAHETLYARRPGASLQREHRHRQFPRQRAPG